VPNANAIRMEDKKGSEQLWIHAEKNQDIEVESDETHWVGHDRKKTIDNDEVTNVKNNRTETVGSNEKITIGVDRTENVGANENITIGASRTETVAASESITIGASRTESVGASESITIGASRTDNISASLTQTIGGSLTQTVAGGITISTPGKVTISAAGGYTVVAPGGTNTIDSWFTKIGGKDEDLFAVQTAILTMQTTICAVMSIQMQAMKVDTTGFTFERTGVKSANEPLTLQQAGTKLKQGAVGLYMYGITLLN
jgi:type VI secretion system secreted protein VgrG